MHRDAHQKDTVSPQLKEFRRDSAENCTRGVESTITKVTTPVNETTRIDTVSSSSSSTLHHILGYILLQSGRRAEELNSQQ